MKKSGNEFRVMVTIFCLSFLTACSSRSEQAFTQGCMAAAGQDNSTCSCAYDKMKEYYPSGVMDHINEPTWQQPHDFGEVTVKAIVQCRPDYQEILSQAR